MKQNYTHIAVVLDRSGSMGSCKAVTIEGLNAFLTKQKETKGEGTITLVQFDDKYEVNYDFLPLSNAPLLTDRTYEPRGWTALLDAIGRTIDSTGAKLAAMPEHQRPSRVIFVIQTDGFENASQEYIGAPVVPYASGVPDVGFSFGTLVADKAARVRAMIRHQQERYNWDFVFLGAGQDAILTAQQYGINAKSALTYDTSNTTRAFAAAANYVSGFCNAPDMMAAKLCSFTQSDRDESVNDSITTTTTTALPSTKKKTKVTSQV